MIFIAVETSTPSGGSLKTATRLQVSRSRSKPSAAGALEVTFEPYLQRLPSMPCRALLLWFYDWVKG
jgi:hypothetical protein